MTHARGALARTDVQFKTWLCDVTLVFTLHRRKRQANEERNLSAAAKSHIKTMKKKIPLEWLGHDEQVGDNHSTLGD